MDIIYETREMSHIKEFIEKLRDFRIYNSRVVPRELKERDLVLKQVVTPIEIDKLFPNWEGPYGM